HEAEKLVQVERGKELASGQLLIAFVPQSIHFQPPLPPNPDFADPELAIDFQFVYPARSPHDLDRQIGSFWLFLVPKHVALVRLGAPVRFLLLDRPGTVRRDVDPLLDTPRFDKTADHRLDRLM